MHRRQQAARISRIEFRRPKKEGDGIQCLESRLRRRREPEPPTAIHAVVPFELVEEAVADVAQSCVGEHTVAVRHVIPADVVVCVPESFPLFGVRGQQQSRVLEGTTGNHKALCPDGDTMVARSTGHLGLKHAIGVRGGAQSDAGGIQKRLNPRCAAEVRCVATPEMDRWTPLFEAIRNHVR